MEILKSKRFVVRKSLIGSNQIIEVTFKNGKVFKYDHDQAYNAMSEKLNQCHVGKNINHILHHHQFQTL
jgi:hypothetical protein